MEDEMTPITPSALGRVRDRETLFAFLRDELGWPLDPEDTFTYDEPLLNGGMPRVRVSRLLPFGAGDPFLILLAEWETPLRRTDLREILRAVRARIRKEAAYGSRKLDEIVFVCPAEDYHSVWFAHFEEREGRQPRLEAFGWEADRIEATRTLREVNLPALAMPPLNLLDEADWTVGYKQWLSAWDVEAVTRAFFKDYREVFNGVRDALPTDFTGDRTLWTQRLFNRLLFIHFLSQKREGWLRFRDRRDYLHGLWEGRDRAANFYRAHLRPLFFTALNNRHVRSLREDNPTLHALIGDVPYLNGGLFEKAADDDAIQTVPDDALGAVLALFGRYRFTITESTPDDVEVAVDPEMLGKVFEELITGRHESGSYYTPRPVVAFMCREALKGYLGGGAGIAALVDGRSADSLTRREAAALLHRLAGVRAVDPACGSGAYLLGLLHELYELTGLLELRADPLTARAQYERKLAIIQNALYGVDLDPFAVNVARLRLWLSLAVEHTGDVPEPLPNLDFKVEVGDSLAVPLPQRDLTGDIFRQAQLDEYRAAKRDYGSPYFTEDRKALYGRIDALKGELAAWAHPQQKGQAADPVPGFDWQVEFAEVFTSSEPVADLGGAMNLGGTLAEAPTPGGFDIVLANPPYVRQELIKDQKPRLKAAFPEVYAGTADLYCYFYGRAVQLLKPGGMLAFISPNKWFRAGYGANLRKFLAETCQVDSITDFGDLPVFQAASTYPMIFIAQKGTGHQAVTFTLVKSLNPPYPDVRRVIAEDGQILPENAVSGANWSLAVGTQAGLIPRLVAAGKPLKDYTSSRFYRGVTTGFNDAFVIDGETRLRLIAEDKRSAEIIKPLALGRDIRRWVLDNQDRWLIFTRRSIEIDRYPAIKDYLNAWRKELTPRVGEAEVGRKPGNYKWYEIQDESAYFSVFDGPKIVSTKVSVRPTFCLDVTGHYLGNTSYCCPVNDDAKFILGVLNSDIFSFYAKEVFVGKLNGWYEIQPKGLEAFPIPSASDADQASISALVQKCLDAKGVDCGAWEAEIDARVAALYGL